ncbi:MAG: bifunctional metallophosphatase/5'-nucleotidase [Bacilli bacterium]
MKSKAVRKAMQAVVAIPLVVSGTMFGAGLPNVSYAADTHVVSNGTTGQVTHTTGQKVTIDGKVYAVSEKVEALFTTDNAKALQGAHIIFKTNAAGEITEVQRLIIRASNVTLNAGNAIVHDIQVRGNGVTIKSQSKMKSVTIARGVTKAVVSGEVDTLVLASTSTLHVTKYGATNAVKFVGAGVFTLQQGHELKQATINNPGAWVTFDGGMIDALAIPKGKALYDVVAYSDRLTVKTVNGAPKKVSQATSLTIAHTNDTHAALDSAARRATAIKEIQKKDPNALVLDAGDVFSGTLWFNVYEGKADADIMDMIGYDAMVLGNHEFDKGPSVLSQFVRHAKFPILSANTDFSKEKAMNGLHSRVIAENPALHKVYPAIIKEINGERVGVFGLTTEETPIGSSPGENVKFNDIVATSKQTIAALEAKGINKIVALTHVGFTEDERLAKEVPGIDVIVGGHSHTKVDKPLVVDHNGDRTVIVQAFEKSKFVGELNVNFDALGVVTAATGTLHEVEKFTVSKDAAGKEVRTYTFAEDPTVRAYLDSKSEKIKELRAQVVAETQVKLDGERADVRTKETNLGNLYADAVLYAAQKAKPEVQIAVQNGGGIRASVEKGPITMGDVLTVMPFGNLNVAIQVSGAELKEALEVSVSKYPEQSGGFLQVAGMRYSFDPKQPVGSRVTKIEVREKDGSYKAADPKKLYWLATNSFTADGGDGYTMFKKAQQERGIFNQMVVDYQVFVDYLAANKGVVNPQVEGRITLK